MGLVEVERLREKHDLEVRWAPYFLDPTTPPEGKPARYRTELDAPPTPIEQRAASLGIPFTRGRTHTPNSHLALEAAEFAATRPESDAFHRAMFKAHFQDLEDIGNVETVIRVGIVAGLPPEEFRRALESGEYRQQVDDGIRWARGIGVTGVPTFIFDDRYGVVGAQPLEVLESVLAELDNMPADADEPADIAGEN